jgi:hypothetical protein
MLASDLETLIADQSPHLINLSAGGYTRDDVPPLSFIEFRQRHPDVTLVTAAGNDSTDRKFWRAAFDWAVAVGALGADLQNLAWFSNYGDWVDVYALGEGVVNAFATGVYKYRVPPKRQATQVFDGMARWSGTPFYAPLVAGLIVADGAQSSATDARQAVLGTAHWRLRPVLLRPVMLRPGPCSPSAIAHQRVFRKSVWYAVRLPGSVAEASLARMCVTCVLTVVSL